MNDSVDISSSSVSDASRWLLLIHQIPPKPDYFRVKVRRRLQQLGAVALKNSVYVLPASDDAMEDFQWLRRMVIDEGGEVMLCTATFLEGMSDAEIEEMFRRQANTEYQTVIDAVNAMVGRATDAEVRKLVRQQEGAKTRDFFGASKGEAAAEAVQSLQREKTLVESGSPIAEGVVRRPRGATWVTREGVYVDRMASAWLIRRFIDRAARFKFVPASGYEPAQGELRFDMFEGEFTHVGDQCTFEVLIHRFALVDAALQSIAEIVHDIDCKDEKFGRDEAVGVASVIRGITMSHPSDESRIAAAAELLDGLYQTFGQGGL